VKRPTLFRALLWRELIILIGGLVIIYFISTEVSGTFVNRRWQLDLQGEADWTATLLATAPPVPFRAEDWRRANPETRLMLQDGRGMVLLDTNPEWTSQKTDERDAPLLQAKAKIALTPGAPTASGSAAALGSRASQVILTRYGLLRHPWHNEFILLLAALLGFAAAVLYPLVRSLTQSFERLSQVSRRIADGRFGDTLEVPRQRELAGLVDSFNGMSLRLRDAESKQQRLIADVSHELRSPLGRLRALAEIAARRPIEAPPYLSQMDAEITLLDRLVGDLLDMARFDAGEAALRIEQLPLLPWAVDAFSRSRLRIEEQGVSVSTHLPVTDLVVAMDAQRLLQALSNLVENSLNATRDRESQTIELRLEASLESWSITVADNGRGIPADALPRVFDRFYRVETHRGRQTGGAGLGLSIARNIVTAMGGAMAIASTLGQGTRVSMTFPR
jgi:signal transduction histidine kinase